MENLHEQIEEVDEYNHLLETVLIQLCEELEIDPDELVEDVMTVSRERELSKKMADQGRKTQAAYDRDEKERVAGKRKWGSNSRAFWKQYARSARLGDRYRKEGKSHKVYGKGGKVMKRVKTARQDNTYDSSLRGTRRGAKHIGWSD